MLSQAWHIALPLGSPSPSVPALSVPRAPYSATGVATGFMRARSATSLFDGNSPRRTLTVTASTVTASSRAIRCTVRRDITGGACI